MSQLSLFPSNTAVDFTEHARLASALPKGLHLGTSSWTFPGWEGLVFPRGTTSKELQQRGLELYCANPLFTTVGIDSSFYRPLTPAQLRSYRQQLRPDFRCVSKVYSKLTQRCSPRSLEPNPDFLNAALFEREVLAPIASDFNAQQGPLLLEFPRLQSAPQLPPAAFAQALDTFFRCVSSEFQYAIELRDEHLLSREYLDVLRQHHVAHVFNYWEQMPGLMRQFTQVGQGWAEFAVVRLLIPPGQRYMDRKRQLAPFDRLVDVQQTMRDETLTLVAQLQKSCRAVFVIVNNKAEGSSPLTILELARRFVRAMPT